LVIYAKYQFLRVYSDTRALGSFRIGRKTMVSLYEITPVTCDPLVLGRRAIVVQRHNDADVERGTRAQARSFVRSEDGSRRKPRLCVLTATERCQR
jgi:hypothetical protein